MPKLNKWTRFTFLYTDGESVNVYPNTWDRKRRIGLSVIPIECVKNFQYLGFHISYNMKFKNLIADREAKAMKMANMVHRALRTSNNVSIKLSMSLLDKQIIPILLYGSAVWGLPDTHNLIYLEDQPESQNTRTAARDVLKAICGYDVPFSSARRVGKNQGHYRSIMIRLKIYRIKRCPP